jgi:carboxyl-terminal processing protease
MVNSKKPKKQGLGPFGKGMLATLAVAFIFYSGVQFGSGAWAFSFGRGAVTSNQDLPNQLDFSSLDQVYRDLRQRFDGELDADKLIDGAKKGLVDAAGDPFTSFLDAEATAAFNESLNGSFEGIGAELSREENLIIVVAPLSGFPAEQAGLRARDVIVEIDGQDATNISVEEAVKRIRGEAGTNVKLGVVRGSESKEFDITRSTITVPSVKAEIIQDGTIGYIELSRYSDDTLELVKKATQEFKDKNVKGVILDVRNNPGGFLNGAVNVSEIWLKTGDLILQEKRDGQVIESFKAGSRGTLAGMPTVVLINEGSASASEITAGALKDNQAATLVGVTTFGKGQRARTDTVRRWQFA